MIFPPRSPPLSLPKFRIDAIKPSPIRLEDLGATPRVSATTRLSFLTRILLCFSYHVHRAPLPEYAADLLAAFRDLTVSKGILFTNFVIRSCLPKITHRLGANLYVFMRSLEDNMDGWSPGLNDTQVSKQVRAGKSYTNLLAHLASARVVGEEDQYDWNLNTTCIWITALCHVIRDAKQFASSCRVNRTNNTINTDALHALIQALTALFLLLYCMYILQLLSLCGM